MAAVYQQQTTPIYPTLTQSDIDIRDPNDINKHLRLDFFNVIAEPDHSAYSWEFLHTASNYVYQYSKLFIYRLLTILIGLPLMLFWGLTFGAYTFMMIWIAVPSRRLAQSLIAESGVYIQSFCDAVIGPVHRSMGLLFSNIRITYNPVVNAPKTIEV